MTDAQLLDVIETIGERPRLTIRNTQYVHIDGAVMVWTRVGKRERWSIAPGRDVHRIDRLPTWWPREVREWARRAELLDVVAHARAMSQRTF